MSNEVRIQSGESNRPIQWESKSTDTQIPVGSNEQIAREAAEALYSSRNSVTHECFRLSILAAIEKSKEVDTDLKQAETEVRELRNALRANQPPATDTCTCDESASDVIIDQRCPIHGSIKPATDATARTNCPTCGQVIPLDSELRAASQRPPCNCGENAGDWTLSKVIRMIGEPVTRFDVRKSAERIFEAINAALAAERETTRQWKQTLRDEIKQLRQQLAAEREKREAAERDAMRMGGLALQAQAAIAEAIKLSDKDYHADCTKPLRTVDLSVLDNHDAEARKPLVDAMQRCIRAIINLEGQEIAYPLAIALSKAVKFASDALAKIK